MTLQLAYLVNQYPSVSHTFIRREIHALERQGVTVHRLAIRGWDAPLVDEKDRKERTRTHYVLRGGLPGLVAELSRAALAAPGTLLSATLLSIRMSRGSDKSLLVHLAYLAEACAVRRRLAASNVTHIHAHFATNSSEVAMLVTALGGPPYSFTAHGSDIMDRPAQMGLEEKVRRAAFAVAVCSFGRSQLLKWLPFDLWNKVNVVRCGLEQGYAENTAQPQSDSHRLVCIGRLSKEKGQSLLIQAAAQVAASGRALEVVLAGDGPMRSELESLIVASGLSTIVRITGWLDAQGIEHELRQARALVVSSLSEGLPVVIMEAMAHHRPVIAPYLAGIPELVTHRETGWLFPAGDTSALASAIRDCLDTPSQTLLQMGDIASERVWKDHDADVEARKLIDLLGHPVRKQPPLPDAPKSHAGT